jgi:hypothetical protein
VWTGLRGGAHCRRLPVNSDVEQHMRTLRDHEVPLVRRLLAVGGRHECAEQLLIEPLVDGQMGSLRIGEAADGRRLSHAVAEVRFFDADGTLVTAVLNIDFDGELLEVDIWKVDSSALRRWPSDQDLVPVLSNLSLQRTASPPAEGRPQPHAHTPRNRR